MNKIENARIVSTRLGEEHGCLTADIAVEGEGWGCMFGGYCLITGAQKQENTTRLMDMVQSLS